jgi:hypothetical protein
MYRVGPQEGDEGEASSGERGELCLRSQTAVRTDRHLGIPIAILAPRTFWDGTGFLKERGG